MTNSTEMALPSTNNNIKSAKKILNRLFSNFDGCLGVRLWDGSEVRVGPGQPAFTLVFRSAKAFQDLVLPRHPLNLSEAYFQGLVDVDGDMYSAFKLRHYLTTLDLSVLDRTGPCLLSKPCASDRQKQRWLPMRCRAGLNGLSKSLAQVSARLPAGMRFLFTMTYPMNSMRCGWGALVCWAAEHYGAIAHGITLSRKQHDHARKIIKERGLEGKASVELLDYRDLSADNRYNKLVSVGMFEHGGLKNLPRYFAAANRVLKPGVCI